MHCVCVCCGVVFFYSECELCGIEIEKHGLKKRARKKSFGPVLHTTEMVELFDIIRLFFTNSLNFVRLLSFFQFTQKKTLLQSDIPKLCLAIYTFDQVFFSLVRFNEPITFQVCMCVCVCV